MFAEQYQNFTKVLGKIKNQLSLELNNCKITPMIFRPQIWLDFAMTNNKTPKKPLSITWNQLKLMPITINLI